MDKNINWNEKYRPNNLEKIILSNYNRLLIKNILEKNYFPNLLALEYGYFCFFFHS